MSINRETIFSPCRGYRYTLWRQWVKHEGDLKTPPFDGELKPVGHSDWNSPKFVQFIGLNPSTADETNDDPTIRRCIQFAKDFGAGAFCMTNIFAWRDTDPSGMKKVSSPIGQDNDDHLIQIGKGAMIIIAAWGTHGSHMYRGIKVKRLFSEAGLTLHCLGRNSDQSPKHPLYLAKNLRPVVFE